MVLPIGDPAVAVIIEGDPPRLVEFTVASSTLATFGQELAIRAENLQAIVAAINDNDVTVLLAYQTSRPEKLAIAAARFPPFAEEVSTRVEHRDRVLPFV